MQPSSSSALPGTSSWRTLTYIFVVLVTAGVGVLLAQKFERLEQIPLSVGVAGVIFVITYTAILSEIIHRTIAAVAGAMAMVLAGHWLGFFSQDDAVQVIDWHTIGLLVAMMVIVAMLQKTGFFEYLAIITAKRTMGDPWRLTALLGVVIAVVSTMVANVVCVVMFAPVTVVVCEILGLNPVPMLMAEALLSNIGGLATLVGDPPNMMIGSVTGLTFNDFLIHLGPPTAVILVVGLYVIKVVMRKDLAKKPENIEGLLKMDENAAVHDWPGIKKILVCMGIVLLLFFLQGKLGLLPSSVAFLGLAIALLWVQPHPDDTLKEVHWSILLFFIALFVCVGGIEKAGILDIIGEKFAVYAHGNLMLACVLLFWVSAISSAIVDNIPFTIAMIPIIQHLEAQGVNAMPLWWSLAMGVGLGGNGTIVGATPNIVVVSISERTKYPITSRTWFLAGTTTTIVTCIVATAIVVIFFKFFQ